MSDVKVFDETTENNEIEQDIKELGDNISATEDISVSDNNTVTPVIEVVEAKELGKDYLLNIKNGGQVVEGSAETRSDLEYQDRIVGLK